MRPFTRECMFFKETECMCVYSSVRDTLTLLLSQVGRQVFTSRSSFLSTTLSAAAMETGKKKNPESKVMVSYLPLRNEH